MGSQLVVRQHSYVDRAALQQWVSARREEDSYENGNSYSGYWNMCSGLSINESKVFATVQEATDHISDHQEKWGPLLAVPAWVQMELPDKEALADKPLQELVAQMSEINNLIWQQNSTIVKRTKEGKTRMRGCGSCESRINVEHLRSVNCPVCNQNLLRTPTDDKQLEAWRNKLKALQEKAAARRLKLVQAKYKLKDPTQKVWVVGGWCAS